MGRKLQLRRFSPRSEGSEPYIRPPSPASCTGETSPYTVRLWRPVGLIFKRARGLWEIENLFQNCAHKTHKLWDPGQKQEFERSLDQTHCLILESLPERQKAAGAHPGDTDWQQPFWGMHSIT